MLCLGGRDVLAVINDGGVNAAAYPRSRVDDDVANKRGINRRPLNIRTYWVLSRIRYCRQCSLMYRRSGDEKYEER